MIAAIQGLVLECGPDKVYIQSSGGVVYEVLASPQTLSSFRKGSEGIIYTSLIVRENEMFLTGFSTLGEKNLFEILITAKGIGPKQGLKILEALGPSELRMAIISKDSAALARIKGLGAKKAEQLILDLKSKLEVSGAESLPPNSGARKKTEILLTMRALGYTDGEIKKPLDTFFDSCNAEESVESLVSLFLRSLKP